MTDYGDEPARVLDEDKRILNDAMHAFYQFLPGNEVDQFSLADQTEDSLKEFRGRIDLAQETFEEIEAMRLHLTSVYTEGELEDMNFGQLQRLAKLNKVDHRQSKNVLIAEMTGRPRTIRAWRQMEQLIPRLRKARERADHPHPRQQAAMPGP